MDLEVINLFRKTITSLSCIEKLSNNESMKNEATLYLVDLASKYKEYINTHSIKNIKFNYREEDIIDFSYRCIEDKENDFVRVGEDIQYGFTLLMKLLK